MHSGVFSGEVPLLPARLSHTPTFRLVIANLLLILAIPASAAANNCDSAKSSWTANQNYSSGEMVFYHGQWYEAGTLNQAHKPGTDSLSWRPLAKSPDCADTKLVPKKSKEPALDTTPADRPGAQKNSKSFEQTAVNPPCDSAPVWSLSQSYAVGDYATHEGQTFRAIKASQGDLPGVAKPPHWVAVDNDCPDQQSSR